MSLIFVQVGQCGNQVGHEFWKIAGKERSQKNSGFQGGLFHGNGYARCIMIDSEPKVIQRIIGENNELYNISNVRFSQSGCGNNWALGYNFSGNSKGMTDRCAPEGYGKDMLLQDAMELLERELESCDYAKACVVIHSLSGGTGSGLGSRLIEEIRNKHPTMYIISICVAPFAHGDTPMQHYNCLLSLSHIQSFCDAVFMFQNDDILRAINRATTKAGHTTLQTSHYSTTDINKYIASCMANIFFPVQNDKGVWSEFDCFKFIRNLCPSFETKFLEINTNAILESSAGKFSSWQYIADDFAKHIPVFMLEDNIPCKSISTKIMVRGGFQTIHDYSIVKKALLNKAFAPVEWLLYAPNQEEYLTFDVSHAPALPGHRISNSLTTCSNRSYIVSLLNHILSRAHVMMESKAYLHWYGRHGVEESMFDECFATVQKVIDDYVLLYQP
ncbi:tubulin delta [Acrasis kona]|uniref:Tubulin delta chain n=1 Tax=Acrasis kona TaxID=1008807 RepID=A0AAW2ZDW5_9EUKA